MSALVALFLSIAPLAEAGIKPGVKYWASGFCKGQDAGEVFANAVEISRMPSAALVELSRAGICVRSSPMATTVTVIRALIDWEGDEAFFVRFNHPVTGEPSNLYGVVWEQNIVVSPSNSGYEA